MSDTEVKSKYFIPSDIVVGDNSKNDICEDFLNIINELNYRLEYIAIPPPVACIYNSTQYARTTFEQYVRKYCNTKKPIMYFGMNPGPWGMSQTGVNILNLYFREKLQF